jgi:hypothetical protein
MRRLWLLPTTALKWNIGGLYALQPLYQRKLGATQVNSRTIAHMWASHQASSSSHNRSPNRAIWH